MKKAISEISAFGSLQSPTQRFGRLPRLLIANVGVSDRGADILVAEQFLDLPQVFSNVVE